MEQRAPLWRPFLMATVGYGLWLARQSPARLEARHPATYAILAGLLAGCAVGAWGVQRARGQRWPWYREMLVMLGLLMATALALKIVLPLVLG